ncbi:MAG: N-6 DNA methylase [Myxococcales bacterium]|nr:N-6 DNA methylase [Myxococcales bacterium]
MSLSMPGLNALSRGLARDGRELGPDAAQPHSTRRAQGAFFTPQRLVSFVVRHAVDLRMARGDVKWHEDGYPLLRILDPAAGDGRFLVETTRELVRRGQELGHSTCAREIRKHCLIAIERDATYAAVASENLEGQATVHCTEALFSELVADGSIDIVLGNPPYLRSIALGRVDEVLRTRLRGRYSATSYGEWDLYAAFLEQGIEWLSSGGILGMVVPSRWWTAKWAGPLRETLASRGALSALVDFGDHQVFSDATVYTSLCFAGAQICEEVQVARLAEGAWELGQVMREDLQGREPWDLAVGASREIVQHLRKRGRPLGELAHIAKGTGTNADSVFVIESPAREIESELLHSVLRGRDVSPLGGVPEWPRLLLPYDSEGLLIAPEVMRDRYPKAHCYLLEHREHLEARERGRFAGAGFYCFGRPQNLAFLRASEPKVVVPDITRGGRALVDREAAMVLDSAYAIRLHPDAGLSHETLCGILCSRMVGLWLRSQGMPLRGGYTRMKTAYLKGIPIPASGSEPQAIGELVAAGAELHEIDEQVRIACDMPMALWNHGCDSG